MGILKTYFTTETITIEGLKKLFEEKLGDELTYKASEASGTKLSKAVTGKSHNTLTISKNAYHRTVITLQEMEGKTYIYFGEDTLEWWLQLLNKNFGVIGSIIIGLIYGSGDEFYNQVQNVVKSSIKVEEQEVKTGISALFGKK